MFCKLAARNVKRSFRDYSVYFITLVFGVCVFYTFNALDGQSVLLYLAKSQHYMVESILTIVNVFSVFVSVILAAVILYANTFMMKRRKKELGTYFLLGLPTGKVSALLFLETLLIGVLALVVGVAVGVVFSFALSALSGAMFQVSVDFLHLNFSVAAVGKTVLYFGIMFLLVMIFNGFSVARCKLIDLLQASRRNEDMREQPLGRSVALFLLGVVLLIAAYAMLLIRGIFAIDPFFFLMLAMGALGTLLFFRAMSGFVLKVCRSNPRFYYQGLNMFTLRQFNSKIHTTYLSMTAICLMLLLAIGITACSVGLNNTINAVTEKPFDVTIVNYSGDEEQLDLLAALRQGGFDTNENFLDSYQWDVYYATEEQRALTGASEVMALQDYNTLMTLTGGERISLAPGEHMLSGSNIVNGGLSSEYLVVDAGAAAGLEVRRQILVANYQGDREQQEEALSEALPALYEDRSIGVYSRLADYLDTLGSKVLVIFLGLYLGVIFLLASAAVLALQQLSQAADNAERYAILARLGADEKLRRRSVFVQVFLAFFAPLALAVVHSVVGMTSANAVIAQVGRLDATLSTVVTAVFLLVIYGAYFLATYAGCRRLAQGNS